MEKVLQAKKNHPLVLNDNEAQTNYLLNVKPIENYFEAFMNKNLNQLSIRSYLISQPINDLNSNDEPKLNSTDLLPITFSLIITLNYTVKTQ